MQLSGLDVDLQSTSLPHLLRRMQYCGKRMSSIMAQSEDLLQCSNVSCVRSGFEQAWTQMVKLFSAKRAAKRAGGTDEKGRDDVMTVVGLSASRCD